MHADSLNGQKRETRRKSTDSFYKFLMKRLRQPMFSPLCK